MDNYLLMGHILKCKVIPKDEVHPQLWVGANRKFRHVPRDRIARVQHNKVNSTNFFDIRTELIWLGDTAPNGGEHPESRKTADETSGGTETEIGRGWHKI